MPTSSISLFGRLWYALGAAIVAVFAFATARLVPALGEPYWAAIAAVVVLAPDRAATRQAATDRLFGTLIGSFVGWGTAAWWHHSLAIFGLATFVAVGVCQLLRLERAARLCAVTVSVIVLIPRDAPAGAVALERFVEVSYGIACAVAFMALADQVRRRLPPQRPA